MVIYEDKWRFEVGGLVGLEEVSVLVVISNPRLKSGVKRIDNIYTYLKVICVVSSILARV